MKLISFETYPDIVFYLKVAVLYGILDVVKALVAQGADPKQQEHRMPNRFVPSQFFDGDQNLNFSAFEISTQLTAEHETYRFDFWKTAIHSKNDRPINDFLVSIVQERRQPNCAARDSNIESHEIRTILTTKLICQGQDTLFLTNGTPDHPPLVQLLLHPVKKLHSYACNYNWYAEIYYATMDLSFSDALLIRLGYILSYTILILLEAGSIIVWLVKIPKPPPLITARALVIVLALVWLFGKICGSA
jgi:hypothetical protein